MMRTMLTLDDDVAEVRRADRSFREVVNKMLRRGFASRRSSAPRQEFRLIVRGLGDLKPGFPWTTLGN